MGLTGCLTCHRIDECRQCRFIDMNPLQLMGKGVELINVHIYFSETCYINYDHLNITKLKSIQNLSSKRTKSSEINNKYFIKMNIVHITCSCQGDICNNYIHYMLSSYLPHPRQWCVWPRLPSPPYSFCGTNETLSGSWHSSVSINIIREMVVCIGMWTD